MLKRPALSKLSPGQANYVRFRLSPDVTIAIGARAKRPGEKLIGDPTELKVVNHPRGDEMLEALQRDAFGYFLYENNPENGLVIDRSQQDAPASIAAVGFALAVYPICVE